MEGFYLEPMGCEVVPIAQFYSYGVWRGHCSCNGEVCSVDGDVVSFDYDTVSCTGDVVGQRVDYVVCGGNRCCWRVYCSVRSNVDRAVCSYRSIDRNECKKADQNDDKQDTTDLVDRYSLLVRIRNAMCGSRYIMFVKK